MAEQHFSDRPDHPDFWLLSAVVQDMDTGSGDVGVERIIKPVIDPGSLIYVAAQRAMRAYSAEGGRPGIAMLGSLWLDAFTAGALYQQRKASVGG